MWDWLTTSVCADGGFTRGTFWMLVLLAYLSGMWVGWLATYASLKRGE
jgi:hypothetical protein